MTWELEELTAQGKEDIATPCEEYQDRLPEWEIIDAVVKGGLYLKKKCHQFLPREPMEDDKAYGRRIARTYFSPWYTQLRNIAIAQVLRRPITLVDDDAPEKVIEQLENVDLQGNNWNSFARTLLESSIDRGGSAVLVDYPELPSGARTLADTADFRPYWRLLCATNIIDWHYEETLNGRQLSHIRFKQTTTKVRNRYRKEKIEQIKSLTLEYGQVTYEVWSKIDDEWALEKIGVINLDFIPVFPLFDFGTPPKMLDIAALNIKHYQRCNDRDHALHIAGNPKLALFGYNKPGDDISGSVTEAVIFDNPNGRMEWVVAASINFEAQERHIAELVNEMTHLALSAMVGQKEQAESGVSKILDRTQSDSMLSVLSQALQDCYNKALMTHCIYLSEARVPTCQVNRDFQITRLSNADIRAYSELVQLGQLPLRQLLLALKDGEWLEDDVDIEEILEELKSEYGESETLAPEAEISDDGQSNDGGRNEQNNENNSD